MGPRPTLKSVHFTGTESFSKQIFSPARYNVPLFVCKRLALPVKHRDELNVLQRNRRKLLQRTKSYEESGNRKAEADASIKTEIGKPTTYHIPFYRCPKSLRNGHKEWMLPPNRYRLGGNISDLAIKSTGCKGPYQCFTDRFTQTSVSSRRKLANTETEEGKIPAEMNKLAHPKRYFVGKIRAGDRHKQRPGCRLALSQATLCWRNPAEPGPNCYFKGIFDIPTGVVRSQRRERQLKTPEAALAALTSVRHSYCAEPFPRPPPGRYQLSTCVSPPPLPPRPIDSCQQQRPRLDLTFNPYWNPYRQAATLRMHTVDIPVRRRKRGRNMKVAFGSGSARFKDQEFFPIGALKSSLPKKGCDGVNRKMVRTVTIGKTETPLKTAETVTSSGPAEKTDPLADLNRTRTKLFVIPRRDQTRFISSVETPSERVGDSTMRGESFEPSETSRTSALSGGSRIVEAEVLVTKALTGH
ncbi:uncharacterized protein LOC131684966 isoform X2 [Topomyia yanbarensis]|uniref:uncharacterized protein LOC131684966 isoform X2 n=1 Tax=Topomyia yanbarensis TaxID=2498891 RepID=UPI00273B5E5C|nr:uncharacterized protein LOC131684966 isoform X2 [Topomyia yanbarensis]